MPHMTPKQLVEQQGYAFLPSFLPDLDAATAASVLGVPEQLEGLELVQELSPKQTYLSTPNTYSGNFGFGTFPFHTDLAHWAIPPRYILLWCSRGDETTKTQFIDSNSVIQKLGVSTLTRCLAQPRRPMKGSLQLLPILQASTEQLNRLIRWDSIYLKPSNVYAQTVFEEIHQHLAKVKPIIKSLTNRGDTLIMDNWRLLHGRSQVKEMTSARLIHRVYLSSLI